jgi:hypothetical protein
VKKNYLLESVFVMMLLSSGIACAESHYPAADFKPKVVFEDKELIVKHTEAAKTRVAPAANETAAATSADESTTTSVSATNQKSSDETTYLLIFVAVAVIGFFVFSNKSKGGSSKASAYKAYVPDASGLTGVARYLKGQEESLKTGVQKYLEQQDIVEASAVAVAEASVSSGVEKYIQKKTEEDATGVEKYLRGRG